MAGTIDDYSAGFGFTSRSASVTRDSMARECEAVPHAGDPRVDERSSPLSNLGFVPVHRLYFDRSVLLQVKPPTGEPCAGEPHARFGGKGDRDSTGLPYPYVRL